MWLLFRRCTFGMWKLRQCQQSYVLRMKESMEIDWDPFKTLIWLIQTQMQNPVSDLFPSSPSFLRM